MRLPPLIVAGVVFTLCRLVPGGAAPPPRDPGPSPAERDSRGLVPPAPVDSDLEAIRDIFRFGDDGESDDRRVVAVPDRPELTPSVPTPPPGARLVGLVRRADGLRAALVLEGEVVVLGVHDSALGYTVLDVREERVVIRDPEGEEVTLSVGPS